MGSTGLRRLLDVVLPEQQLAAEDHVGVWDARTGTYAPGFPAQMNDLQFFNTPAIVDVDGDGAAEVLQSSAMYDLRAYSLGGLAPATWPKFTAGWSVSTPAAGDLDGDGRLDVALATREGNLFVWRTASSACGPGTTEWPKYGHDLRNTSTYGTDATPPAAVSGARVVNGVLSWSAAGDDGVCGRASAYVVSIPGLPALTLPATSTRLTVPLGVSSVGITVQAVDDAGNRSVATAV
jgi:hypothetical protein